SWSARISSSQSGRGGGAPHKPPRSDGETSPAGLAYSMQGQPLHKLPRSGSKPAQRAGNKPRAVKRPSPSVNAPALHQSPPAGTRSLPAGYSDTCRTTPYRNDHDRKG